MWITETRSVQKDTLSWLWTRGLHFSHHLTLSAGGLCTVRSLLTLTRQAWPVHLIVGTLLDCLVHCWSQRVPLYLVSPSAHIQLLHEKGFFCCWITWFILVFWFVEAVFSCFYFWWLYLYSHWDAWCLHFPIIHLRCLNFLPPLSCLKQNQFEVGGMFKGNLLWALGFQRSADPSSLDSANAIPCSCLKKCCHSRSLFDCVCKELCPQQTSEVHASTFTEMSSAGHLGLFSSIFSS